MGSEYGEFSLTSLCTVITRFSVGRRNLGRPLIPGKILLNYLEVTDRGKKEIKNRLLYDMGVEKNIDCLWVCLISNTRLITIDSQCFFICFLIRLVLLSCTKMKKMTSLQAVSKKLAMADLSGIEFLVTSPERIPGKPRHWLKLIT